MFGPSPIPQPPPPSTHIHLTAAVRRGQSVISAAPQRARMPPLPCKYIFCRPNECPRRGRGCSPPRRDAVPLPRRYAAMPSSLPRLPRPMWLWNNFFGCHAAMPSNLPRRHAVQPMQFLGNHIGCHAATPRCRPASTLPRRYAVQRPRQAVTPPRPHFAIFRKKRAERGCARSAQA
jgi:hypothetical protein